MYVCLCRGITDNQIRKAVQAGKTEFRQLKQSLEVGAQCGKCVRMAMEIIATEIDKMESEQAPLYTKWHEIPLPASRLSERMLSLSEAPIRHPLMVIFLD